MIQDLIGKIRMVWSLCCDLETLISGVLLRSPVFGFRWPKFSSFFLIYRRGIRCKTMVGWQRNLQLIRQIARRVTTNSNVSTANYSSLAQSLESPFSKCESFFSSESMCSLCIFQMPMCDMLWYVFVFRLSWVGDGDSGYLQGLLRPTYSSTPLHHYLQQVVMHSPLSHFFICW